MPSQLKPTKNIFFKNIKAISFDLDDTLYDNKPVIEQAYLTLYNFLIQHYPAIATHFSFDEFIESFLKIKHLHPQVVDLNLLRHLHIEDVLTSSNCHYEDIFLDESFDIFWQARQKIYLFPETRNVLATLKKQFPLIALSNGNACIKAIGLAPYFNFSVNPLDTGKAKPDPSMFLFSCEKLAIKPEQLLHVGDKINIDVEGANNAGCQSIWFNIDNKNTANSAGAIINNLQDLLAINFIT